MSILNPGHIGISWIANNELYQMVIMSGKFNVFGVIISFRDELITKDYKAYGLTNLYTLLYHIIQKYSIYQPRFNY